jgi:type IV secretory pathway VirB4 component
MNYWEECVSRAFDEAGIIANDEQLGIVVSAVEGGHENYGMAFGHDCIPNPRDTDIRELKKSIEQLKDDHERVLRGVRKGVAERRKVDLTDVNIDDEGLVTYKPR